MKLALYKMITQLVFFFNFFASPKKLQKKRPKPMYFQSHWNRFKKLAKRSCTPFEYHRAF
jgi:hypothetical protein